MTIIPPTKDVNNFFTASEFFCKCGKCAEPLGNPVIQINISTLIESLNIARVAYKRPIAITSGYRCPEYNDLVSKTGRTGPHTTGLATDLHCDNSSNRWDLFAACLFAGFRRIGVAKTFIHVDLCKGPKFAEPVIWLY